MPTELELDHCFWNTIRDRSDFRSWFVSKTKFRERLLELVTDEKWHQRWYRDPISKRDSETDILLMFRDLDTTERVSIHIENKPDHRKWESLQAENYRKRAIDRMNKWRYVDFQTVLIAPESFLLRSVEEVKHFDVSISYEELSAFVPEFSS